MLKHNEKETDVLDHIALGCQNQLPEATLPNAKR